MPACAISAFAAAISCSAKWKIEAASTASALSTMPATRVIERPDTPAGDHRDAGRVRHRPGQLQVVASLGAVAIHRGQEDLAGAAALGLLDPGEHVDAGRRAAAVDVDLPRPGGTGWTRPTAGVDRADDALRAELDAQLRDQLRALHRRRVHADLVRALPQQAASVLDTPDAAADRQREEDLLGRPGHDVDHGVASVRGGGDVEEDQLVAFGVVAGGHHWVAGVPQADELDALADAPSVTSRQGSPWRPARPHPGQHGQTGADVETAPYSAMPTITLASSRHGGRPAGRPACRRRPTRPPARWSRRSPRPGRRHRVRPACRPG